MHELVSLQIPFNIKGEINSEIVRYPELIPGIIVDIGNVVYVIERIGIGYGTAGHIYQI
jgi:hypothetical protein